MHIGMNKAGSSSIQASFDMFDDGRVRYARLGAPNHSVRIVSLFCSDPEKSELLSRRKLTPAVLDELRPRRERQLSREIALGRDTLVISGEAIGHMKAPDLVAMKTWFEARGCPLRLFAYIREPLGFASSAFQQRVKAEKSSFYLGLPEYRKQFEKFIELFGRDRIEFLDFRREHLRGGSVVTDFAARAGIDPSTPVPEVRTNESLSTTAVAFLYFWNQEREEIGWDQTINLGRHKLIDALRLRFPGKFRLSPALVRSAIDRDDVAWMERVGGLDLSFEIDRPVAPEGGADEVGSEDDLAAARDRGLGEVAAMLDELEIQRPPRLAAYPLMKRLFRHYVREARRELKVRQKAREAAA
jgi:hypothetical protein